MIRAFCKYLHQKWFTSGSDCGRCQEPSFSLVAFLQVSSFYSRASNDGWCFKILNIDKRLLWGGASLLALLFCTFLFFFWHFNDLDRCAVLGPDGFRDLLSDRLRWGFSLNLACSCSIEVTFKSGWQQVDLQNSPLPKSNFLPDTRQD